MADARMPDEFYELARPLLPPEKQVGPQGGRPPIGHYEVLKVIWFALVNLPEVVTQPLGSGQRYGFLHRNVPGVLRDINRIVSELNANIHAQVLSTDPDIGACRRSYC